MEAVRRAHPPGQDAGGGESAGEIADGRFGAGDHATSELVDGGQVDVGSQVISDVVGA